MGKIEWVWTRTNHKKSRILYGEEMWPYWANFRHRLHRKLSFWQYVHNFGGVPLLGQASGEQYSYCQQGVRHSDCIVSVRLMRAWTLRSLRWRYNGRDGVPNHQPHDCFTQPFIRAQIKETIKAPRHWPLCGEFTGNRWIPRTND